MNLVTTWTLLLILIPFSDDATGICASSRSRYIDDGVRDHGGCVEQAHRTVVDTTLDRKLWCAKSLGLSAPPFSASK